MDRIKDAERPLTITLRRVPWTNFGTNQGSVLPSRPILETQIPQAHQKSNPKVVAATAQSRNDAEVIQDLQIENAKLREELQLSNAENQVSSAQACECPFTDN